MDMATAMATMATMERGRLRPTLLLSLAMATTDMATAMATAMDTATDMATATDTMATTARGRLSLLPLLRPPLLLSLVTDTTAVVMVTDTATDTMATTAKGRLSLLLLRRLLLSPDMATTAVD